MNVWGEERLRWWMSEVMNFWGDECLILQLWVMNIWGDECRGDECRTIGKKSVSFSMRRRVVEPPIAMERSHIYQSHHGGKSTLMRWGHSEKCSHINGFSIYQEIWGSMRMKSLRRMVLRGARHLYEGTQRDFMRHNRPHTKDLCPVEIHEGQRS